MWAKDRSFFQDSWTTAGKPLPYKFNRESDPIRPTSSEVSDLAPAVKSIGGDETQNRHSFGVIATHIAWAASSADFSTYTS